MSDPLRLNGALDGLVLGGLQVFGVPSPPLYVLANGDKVRDFTYRSDTKVSSLWLSTTSSAVCLLRKTLMSYCRLVSACLSSVLLIMSTAVSVSSLRSWQWPAWLCPCQRCLQSNGLCDALNFITQDPLGAFGLFTADDNCQLIFPWAVLTIPGLKSHLVLALPLCPNQRVDLCKQQIL